MPSIDYLAILPALVLLGASVLTLMLSALLRHSLSARVATSLSVLAGLVVLATSVAQWVDVARHGASSTIDHAVVLDGFSVVATGVIGVSLVMASLIAHDWLVRGPVSASHFYTLSLAASAGALVMVQANDLVVIFLGLEILSIGLYVLAALDRHRSASAEAALKYFLLGGFASAIFIYGAALVYGATGTTNLSAIGYFLAGNVLLAPGLLVAGGALLLVGFAFKVAAVPFHLWSPDVYEGAPTPVTGFMASVVKVGAFAALLRVLVSALSSQLTTWRPIIWVLVALSTLVGASMALVQRNVKRMLAYSSINHAGFILLGVWAGTVRGSAGALFYLMTYAPVVLASFGVLALVGGARDDSHDIDRFRGLARRQPVLGAALAVLLLSQLGVPLTTGFYAKYGVLLAAVDAGGGPIALIALIGAAIAAYFYLRWVLALYAEEPIETDRVSVGRASGLAIALGVVATLLFGLWPGPLAALAQHATLLFHP